MASKRSASKKVAEIIFLSKKRPCIATTALVAASTRSISTKIRTCNHAQVHCQHAPPLPFHRPTRKRGREHAARGPTDTSRSSGPHRLIGRHGARLDFEDDDAAHVAELAGLCRHLILQAVVHVAGRHHVGEQEHGARRACELHTLQTTGRAESWQGTQVADGITRC